VEFRGTNRPFFYGPSGIELSSGIPGGSNFRFPRDFSPKRFLSMARYLAGGLLHIVD